SLGHRRPALALGPGAQVIAPVDDSRGQRVRVTEPRASGGTPGGAGLVDVEDRGRLAERLEAEHGKLGHMRLLDLSLELARVNLRAVGRGDQAADLVGRPVDLRAALG